jgi:carbon monoxide dehydrogenase subunit G
VAIRVDERFVVGAPVERVWDHMVDPRRVVASVPGGELTAVVDDRTFDGALRVAIGPLVLSYAGRVRLAEADAFERRVRIVGDAHERAGPDSARLTLESWLAPWPGGGTEVVAHARIDVRGRIVELGRGLLEQLGHLVFQDFAARVRAAVEAEAAGRPAPGPPAAARPEPLRAVPLVVRALRGWVAARLRAGATDRRSVDVESREGSAGRRSVR